MRYTYDSEHDLLYVYLAAGPVARSVEVPPNCVVDLDESGSVVGIEVLGLTSGWPLAEIIERFGLDEQVSRSLASVSTLKPSHGESPGSITVPA